MYEIGPLIHARQLPEDSFYYESVETAEEVHEEDAYAAVFLNVTLIVCILLAYYIKMNRIYFLPER